MAQRGYCHSRRNSPASNPVQLMQRELILDVPRVQRGRGLEKQNPAFFIGDRLMLNSARDHDEFSFLERQEHLVFVLMLMPDEFAFHLVELHLLAVEFACDVGLPVFVDLGEFRGEIDFVHDGG